MKSMALLLICSFLCACASEATRERWTQEYENAVESPLEQEAIRHDNLEDRINELGKELDTCTDPVRAKSIVREMQSDARELSQ
jgi:hypothetical protein